MDITWAFGSAQLSDINVVLTTEEPEAYRQRVAVTTGPAPTRQPFDNNAPEAVLGVSAMSGPDTSHSDSQSDCEVIPAHRLVLFGNSEYFRALGRWEKDDGGQQADSRKPHREDQVAVISLPSKDWFSTARTMLHFMYTQQLEQGLDRPQLLQLLHLGDQYSVAHLRRACLQQLVEVPFQQWPADEMQALCSILSIVSNDTSAGGELAIAASSLLASIVPWFYQLEDAWRSQEKRETFCSLPYDVVVKVLGSEDLVVRSENTVLVAALSWLRTGGKGAPTEQRRQVFLQVRLQQLAVHFVAWLFVHDRDFQELVPARVRSDLVLRLGSPTTVPITQPKRQGADPSLTVGLEASAARRDVLDAIAKCRAGGPQVEFSSPPVRFNGFVQTALLILLKNASDGVVNVWACLKKHIEIGAAGSGPELGFDTRPYHYHLTVGTLLHQELVLHTSAAACVGQLLASLKPGDEPAGVLQGCFDAEGKLVARITLLG